MVEKAIPRQYSQYNTQFEGQLETIGGVLYDTVTYVSAATTNLRMFNVARATLDLSNMLAQGQLPYPTSFLIRAVRLFIKQRPESIATAAAAAAQGGAFDNIAQLLISGVCTLQVGSKPYFQYPLWAIPAGGGAYGNLAVNDILVGGSLADYGNVGYPDSKNGLTLTKPVLIAPQINFFVDLFWPAALTLTRNVNITVLFDGDLTRQVQ